jgi:hypothetical protein
VVWLTLKNSRCELRVGISMLFLFENQFIYFLYTNLLCVALSHCCWTYRAILFLGIHNDLGYFQCDCYLDFEHWHFLSWSNSDWIHTCNHWVTQCYLFLYTRWVSIVLKQSLMSKYQLKYVFCGTNHYVQYLGNCSFGSWSWISYVNWRDGWEGSHIVNLIFHLLIWILCYWLIIVRLYLPGYICKGLW